MSAIVKTYHVFLEYAYGNKKEQVQEVDVE